MPPCNCGGTKQAAQQFLFTAPNGTQTMYQSEVQARAAQIREKGGSYVTVTKS